MLSHKILQSIDFACTCLGEGMEADTREQQLEWFRRMRNALEYVVMELEREDNKGEN